MIELKFYAIAKFKDEIMHTVDTGNSMLITDVYSSNNDITVNDLAKPLMD